MIKTNRGEFKFPDGGIQKDESHKIALESLKHHLQENPIGKIFDGARTWVIDKNNARRPQWEPMFLI